MEDPAVRCVPPDLAFHAILPCAQGKPIRTWWPYFYGLLVGKKQMSIRIIIHFWDGFQTYIKPPSSLGHASKLVRCFNIFQLYHPSTASMWRAGSKKNIMCSSPSSTQFKDPQVSSNMAMECPATLNPLTIKSSLSRKTRRSFRLQEIVMRKLAKRKPLFAPFSSCDQISPTCAWGDLFLVRRVRRAPFRALARWAKNHVILSWCGYDQIPGMLVNIKITKKKKKRSAKQR